MKLRRISQLQYRRNQQIQIGGFNIKFFTEINIGDAALVGIDPIAQPGALVKQRLYPAHTFQPEEDGSKNIAHSSRGRLCNS